MKPGCFRKRSDSTGQGAASKRARMENCVVRPGWLISVIRPNTEPARFRRGGKLRLVENIQQRGPELDRGLPPGADSEGFADGNVPGYAPVLAKHVRAEVAAPAPGGYEYQNLFFSGSSGIVRVVKALAE